MTDGFCYNKNEKLMTCAMWNRTGRRVKRREGDLKLFLDNKVGESIFPLSIFLIKVVLALCLRYKVVFFNR